MRKLLLLSLALTSLAASAQLSSTLTPNAQPTNESGPQSVNRLAVNQPQLPGGGSLYDDFNGMWLDPAKWLPTNPQCWGNVLECVREIHNNKLRLAATNFG